MTTKDEILEKDLPDNLNDFAWAGQLSSKIWNKYKNLVIWYQIFMIPVAVGVGAFCHFVIGGFILNNEIPFPWFSLGVIFFLWSYVGIAIIYQYFLTKKAFLIDIDPETGQYFLNPVLWFKKDHGKYSLNNGIYDESAVKRVLWWIKSGEKYVIWKPWSIEKSVIGNPSEGTLPSSADLAGILSYYKTVKTYSLKKNLSLQQILQYGAFALIIGIELVGILLISGRLGEQ